MSVRIEEAELIFPSEERVALACAERSLELFAVAEITDPHLSRIEHGVLVASCSAEAVWTLVCKVAKAVYRAFIVVAYLFQAEGKKAAYNFCCVLILDPAEILAHVVSSTIRIAASILGVIIPAVCLPSWGVAEEIDLAILKAKVGLLECIAPENEGVTGAVIPYRAESYFGRVRVVHLEAQKSSAQDLMRLNTPNAQVTQASFDRPARLLMLDGEIGSVACRVYGALMSATIPRFTEKWTLESATRSLLRMNNLIAVRGVRGASMQGPADYLGNLEEPHKYLYTIEGGFPPKFVRRPIIDRIEHPQLSAFDQSVATTLKARWITGGQGAVIQDEVQRHSLFPNPGRLEIDQALIELRYFDARGVDLSSFKARLVSNSTPFQITEQALPSKYEYRLVTYLYETEYANWQVQSGSGLFLEHHQFSQTITPITAQSRGFVVLARKSEAQPDELEMIGVHIPYGHTLIIEEGCIHGDTTLSGFFEMGMTSNHTLMGTADTVFLKYLTTNTNVGMRLVGGAAAPAAPVNAPNFNAPGIAPYVVYKDATEDEREAFKNLTKWNRIFNPFSRAYWRS